MKRRTFFKKSALAAVGTSFILPFQGCSTSTPLLNVTGSGRKAKNIIFLVSDGMSHGTLNMADIFSRRRDGKGSQWIDLYREQRITRSLMDTSSSNSIVTDSAAASSSWGGGHRVRNGRLNLGDNGEEHMPILQKFKKAGKKVGCVTTVPITHATPAGFCVVSKSRGEQAEIAEKYLTLKFDVMMGGGSKYFDNRADKRNLFSEFRNADFTVVNDKNAMLAASSTKPVLGVFEEDGLPFELDRLSDPILKNKIPSLAEMTQKAIDLMKAHPEGFVMQVEGGKVDWAAHANDAAGIIWDQLAFDDAVRVAMDFAEKDKNTLVIITTDHGNANPGLFNTKDADKHFDNLFEFKATNDAVLLGITPEFSTNEIIEFIKSKQNFTLTSEQATEIKSYYQDLGNEGVYNPYKLPFQKYGVMQSKHTYIGFAGTDHSSDFAELAMFGPGSEKLKPFVLNTDLHYFMLEAAEVENKF